MQLDILNLAFGLAASEDYLKAAIEEIRMAEARPPDEGGYEARMFKAATLAHIASARAAQESRESLERILDALERR